MGIKTRLLASGKTEDNEFNISLLGFKMAVNEGLTVFNLVDGIVDEFQDESGTDEGEGSNDTYCTSGDFYQNVATPLSAGFTMSSITEPDTSTTGGNPAYGTATLGEYTVPSGKTSLTISVWGAGGGGGGHNGTGNDCEAMGGGAGGFATGTLAVTAGQKFEVMAGEGGYGDESPGCGTRAQIGGGINQTPQSAGTSSGGGGGGLAGVFNEGISLATDETNPTGKAPQIVMVAGSGGGGAGHAQDSQAQPAFFNQVYWNGSTAYGGAGGGLTGLAGGTNRAQTSAVVAGGTGGPSCSPYSIPATQGHFNGGGGDQEQGGQGAPSTNGGAEAGGFLYGGPYTGPDNNVGGGGSGYYGGGAGGYTPVPVSGARNGGGGSSYIGHPQITSGSTEAGSDIGEGGGVAACGYQSSTNEGMGADGSGPTQGFAEDGFVLIQAAGATTTTAIVSNAFAASSVPTTSRIVVFEEDVGTPTLNTDIIASISRDGGSNFTTATLSDSGYVTGSSGQRILTGQAIVSGQPSGQSMRWKLALANNTVKIHGVSLQWS